MRLFIKQRIFSWFDSYDVYDEHSKPCFRVEGQLSWGHKLKVFDINHQELGYVHEQVLNFLPKFEIVKNNVYVGEIKKEFTFFKPVFSINYNGWNVEGDLFGWSYQVYHYGNEIASINKQVFAMSDSYDIDVVNDEDALDVLLLVLAIDAQKCSQK